MFEHESEKKQEWAREEKGKEYQLMLLIAQSREDLKRGVLISSLEIEKVEGLEVCLEVISMEIMA